MSTSEKKMSLPIEAAVSSEDSDPDLVEVRLIVPRGVFVQPPPSPELVSQANSMDVIGIPARRFLEIVRSPRYPGRVLKLGRLRLARRTELMAYLERLSDQTALEPNRRAGAPSARVSLAKRLGLEEVAAWPPKGKD